MRKFSLDTEPCDGCKYWSELCAQSIGCGPMEALCLNSESDQYQRMTGQGCNKYLAGRSVDDPSCHCKPKETP